jgi:hypothetical protein
VGHKAADALSHEDSDVPVAAVLAQPQGGLKESATGSSGKGSARRAAYTGRPSSGALLAVLVSSSTARA